MHFSSFLASEAEEGFLLASSLVDTMLSSLFQCKTRILLRWWMLSTTSLRPQGRLRPQWCSKPKWTSRCALCSKPLRSSTIPASLRILNAKCQGVNIKGTPWLHRGFIETFRVDWFFFRKNSASEWWVEMWDMGNFLGLDILKSILSFFVKLNIVLIWKMRGKVTLTRTCLKYHFGGFPDSTAPS